MKRRVIDSSVFNKLYLDEADSHQAVALFAEAAAGNVELFAPELLYLEVISTANFYKVPISSIVELLAVQTRHLLTLRPATIKELEKAAEITQFGHEKSGYPSIYDALFHAMAICSDATLITTDKRHFVKTERLGHIQMLKASL